MKKTRDIKEILNIQYLPGGEYMKLLQCKLCQDVLFQDTGTAVTLGEFRALLSAITLHFRLQHDLQIVHHKQEQQSEIFMKYFKSY